MKYYGLEVTLGLHTRRSRVRFPAEATITFVTFKRSQSWGDVRVSSALSAKNVNKRICSPLLFTTLSSELLPIRNTETIWPWMKAPFSRICDAHCTVLSCSTYISTHKDKKVKQNTSEGDWPSELGCCRTGTANHCAALLVLSSKPLSLTDYHNLIFFQSEHQNISSLGT